jgi:transposase IS200 family protein
MKPEDRENYGCPPFAVFEGWGSTVHPSQPSFQLVSYTSPVPNRLHRYYGAGYLHFITSSCYQRRPLLASADRRNLFLEILEEVRRRYAFVVVGYVVMPEHFHLLISQPSEEIPRPLCKCSNNASPAPCSGNGIGASQPHTAPSGTKLWTPVTYGSADFMIS